ncbi:YueI family protein [Paenalkalicoccus suaedae]|uniref:YueI family protein n=1 Tax=Paenalkalicoccus suaedae TaxID=2592382 RepID=A0A859FCE9_9BACI|nr:YueI family protein [Paenalkalicoccus suaedae]QKS70919.1 YueI family protein [Paenalkalicoccus suaedae]
MAQQKLEQILQNGMYGTPEIRPEERKLFLGSLAERAHIALTNGQVRKTGMYKEVLTLMEKHKDANLLINGDLTYMSYSNYVQAASKLGVQFTIYNDSKETPLGLVLAAPTAINNQASMFIKDEIFEKEM